MLETLYKERLEKLEARGGIFAHVKEMAWQKAWEIGLPKRKSEVFQNVPLKNLLAWEFSKNKEKKSLVANQRLFPSSLLISLWEGNFEKVSGEHDPKIIVLSLKESQTMYASFYQNRLLQTIQNEKDLFTLLSLGLQEEGVFIYIPPKMEVKIPIEILSKYGEGSYYPMPKILLFVGKESKVDIIYRSEFAENANKGVHELFDLILEPRAKVNFTSMGFFPKEAMVMHHVRATLKKESKLSLWHMTKGSNLSKCDYSIELQEEGSEVSLEGGGVVSEGCMHQTNVFVHHKAPHAKSHQHFKHVVKKGGTTTFQGKIFVDPVAQKTVAYQRNNNLLLEQGARAFSKPGLEIFADDVKASHGATMAELGEEEVFYITSRGIGKMEAKKMLAYGFIEELIKHLPQVEMQTFVRGHYAF